MYSVVRKDSWTHTNGESNHVRGFVSNFSKFISADNLIDISGNLLDLILRCNLHYLTLEIPLTPYISLTPSSISTGKFADVVAGLAG